MGFSLAPVMEIPVVMVLFAAQARQELLPRAMQRVAHRPVVANPPGQAKPDRDSPERLGLEVRARR
jgi:hypothetical protein